MLSLFVSGPLAVMRVYDMLFSDVVSALAQRLPPSIHDLMLVLPTDTKLFHLPERTHASTPEQTSVQETTREAEGADIQEQFVEQAQQNDDLVEQHSESIADVEDQINNAETPADRRKAMMKLRRAEQAGTTSTCGRCGGNGIVPVAMPGGESSTAACPLCQGKGSIQRWGTRGAR